MRPKTKTWLSLWPLALAAGGVLIGFWVDPDQMLALLKPPALWHKILRPLTKSVFSMIVALFAAMMIEALGWNYFLGKLTFPIVRLARLPMVAASSFTSAFVSVLTANLMLSEAQQNKQLSGRALMVTNILNSSWPSFLTHLPTTLMITVSITKTAGLIYAGLMLAAATIRLIAGAILGRLILPPPPPFSEVEQKQKKPTFKEGLQKVKERFFKRALRLIKIVAPIYVLVSIISQMGFFDWLREVFSKLLPGFFLPVEAASMVIFSMAAEFAVGVAAAGAMLEASKLTPVQVAAALILGGIISAPIRAIKFQLPIYLGIFSPRQGLALILVNQGLRVLSLIIVLIVFWNLAN